MNSLEPDLRDFFDGMDDTTKLEHFTKKINGPLLSAKKGKGNDNIQICLQNSKNVLN